MKIERRTFIHTMVGAAAVAALPVTLSASASVKIEFSYWEKFVLYKIHNRIRENQRVYALSDGARHQFTIDDNLRFLPLGRDWLCLGEVRWVVDAEGKYEHHVTPTEPRPAVIGMITWRQTSGRARAST
jgi:hypothetical protein